MSSVAVVLQPATGTQIVRRESHSAALAPTTLAVGDEVVAGPQGVSLARLGDNSATIRIRANTRMQWLSANELKLLAGGVYIDTGGAPASTPDDQTLPLTILAADARITHLGTQFQVDTTSDGTRVLVRDGVVQIVRAEHREQLGRGEAALLPKDSTSIRVSRQSPIGTQWVWSDALSPRIDIENRDLKSVVLALAYQAGLHVRFANSSVEDAVGRTTLHGPALALPPASALRALLDTTPFSASMPASPEGDQITIQSR